MRKTMLKADGILGRACFGALLLLLVLTAGCKDDLYGPPRKSAPAPQDSASGQGEPVRPSEPMLIVGGTTMPMPVPTGFKRIPVDSPLMRAVQAGAGTDEVVLCVFERNAEAASGRAGPGLSLEGLLQREILQVSTLAKWLDAEVTAGDFLKIKQPWQDESVEFNQDTMAYFEDAAKGRLAGEHEFTYNLGMIDSSPQHISFLQVMKHTLPAGEQMYTCSSSSLLWRRGKILRITYNKHIENFGQINAVVAESVGYIQKLQAIDRGSRAEAPAEVSPT